ncbi:hypothetical protein LMG27952_06608 [Paraburkholderia hiiakae]|uniref:DUF1214 domain-containing protein n=1 Tax=Paraburkholderia hiiakae TaxID=1081782 RepID=A0ABM8P7G6_9BURK|nr:DUF1214 domain-containing protein [Paraburkholderia hiiakae]CAD6558314.1 hypothetical protein LMG27952_06608 [Paraburkholderia hiiakae]
MAATISYDYTTEKRLWPDRTWSTSVGGSPVFKADTFQSLDHQISYFWKAYGTSNAMFIAMPGKGAAYFGAEADSAGNRLEGERSYHVHVPANVPVLNYWSFVVYDAETRSLLENGQRFPSISSNDNLKTNPDGSADLYFGPRPPTAAHANWIKTIPGHSWFGGFRLFSPTQEFFDRKWEPGNLERLD